MMALKFFSLIRRSGQGELIARHRTERVKHVDDDLPKISAAYKKFMEGEV